MLHFYNWNTLAKKQNEVGNVPNFSHLMAAVTPS
jgi:hypothetical protein